MILPTANTPLLSADPEIIKRRLKARVGRIEFFAIGLNLAMLGIFLWVHAQIEFEPWDFATYIAAGRADYRLNYYAFWIMPLFQMLTLFPSPLDFILWNAANIAGVFFAARVFGGKAGTTLLTFQMLYILFFGQIIGILIGGLALSWWGIANKRWNVAGLGLILVSAKFQTGVTLGLSLLLIAQISWRDRFRVILVPGIIVLLSLIVYPSWPIELISTLQNAPPNDWGSITLWRWIGPAALLLWLPPLILPIERDLRFIALAAANALTLPYFQQTDLLTLYVLPVGGLLKLLGYTPLLFPFLQFISFRLLALVPLILYGSIILPVSLSRIGIRIGSRRNS